MDDLTKLAAQGIGARGLRGQMKPVARRDGGQDLLGAVMSLVSGAGSVIGGLMGNKSQQTTLQAPNQDQKPDTAGNRLRARASFDAVSQKSFDQLLDEILAEDTE